MKRYLLILILLIASITSFAQDSARIKNIQQLLEITGSAKLGLQVMNSIIDSYKKSYPKLENNNSFWSDFQKEFTAGEMINRIIPVYEKYYTDDDIKQLIQFYQSPVGKKVIATMPGVMQESMHIGEMWGKEVSDKLALKIKEINI